MCHVLQGSLVLSLSSWQQTFLKAELDVMSGKPGSFWLSLFSATLTSSKVCFSGPFILCHLLVVRCWTIARYFATLHVFLDTTQEPACAVLCFVCYSSFVDRHPAANALHNMQSCHSLYHFTASQQHKCHCEMLFLHMKIVYI